jgi:ankyrin repeat protein
MDIQDANPLYYAARLGLQSTVTYRTDIIKVEVNRTDNKIRTALQISCKMSHIDIARLLLERGANVTVANTNGWTPLNSASNSEHVELVKLLLENGADITVASINGWTPLNSASDSRGDVCLCL